MIDEVPLTVDLPALRAAARRFDDEAYRLGHGLAGEPGLAAAEPGWRTALALTDLEAAVHSWFGALAGRVADAGSAIRTAVEGYDAADQRAARRLPTPAR